MSLTDILKGVNKFKPKLDRFFDPLATITLVNGGYAIGAHELTSTYLETGSITHTLALLGAGAGAVALNYFGVGRAIQALKEDNLSKIRNDEGSGVSRWLKTATIAAGLAGVVAQGATYLDEKKTIILPPEPEPTGQTTTPEEKSKHSNILVLENAEGKFVYTGKKSKGGFHIFKYKGKRKKDIDISDLFDKLDAKNQFQNTGYLNVKRENIAGVEPGLSEVLLVAKLEKQKKPTESSEYQKIDYTNKKLQGKIKAGKFEKGFLRDLEKMCSRLDMHAMGLLSVMDYETGGTFSPKIKNKGGSSGTGLIQFMSYTAKGLGTSTSALSKMTQREQLKWVESYFELHRDGGDFSQPRDIALSIFYPAALGKGNNYIIGCKGSGCNSIADKCKTKCLAKKKENYRVNPLDKNKDKKLTAIEYVKPALDRDYLK